MACVMTIYRSEYFGGAAFDFTGRPIAGIVYVKAAGLKNGTTLAAWVRRGRETAVKAERKSKTKKRTFSPALKFKRRRRLGALKGSPRAEMTDRRRDDLLVDFELSTE